MEPTVRKEGSTMTDLIALAFVIYLLVKYGWSAVWWALGILAFAIFMPIIREMRQCLTWRVT